MSIGDNIKALRTENNLTQEELATKIYVTRNAISKWETDKGVPNIDNLKQLSSLFNVSLDQLVNEEDRIVMAIENSKRIQDYKDMFAGASIFLSYCINGILVPYIFLPMNGFNETLVNYVLLPLIYILISVSSIIRDINPKYLIIGSALGMVPVYMLYDVLLPSYSLGLLGIGHYLIFIMTYFVAKQLYDKFKSKYSTKQCMVIFLTATSIITSIYLLHTTISTITLLNCLECNAPWYSVLVVNTVYYSVPMMIPSTMYMHFRELLENKSYM